MNPVYAMVMNAGVRMKLQFVMRRLEPLLKGEESGISVNCIGYFTGN